MGGSAGGLLGLLLGLLRRGPISFSGEERFI
jgi:hypothetical protein